MKQNKKEILNKICNFYSEEKLKTIGEEYQKFPIEKQKVLEESAICSYFLLLKNKLQEEDTLQLYLVLKPFVFHCLNQMELSIKKLLSFLDWYVEAFSNFYSDKKNFTLYLKETRNLNNQMLLFLDTYFEQNGFLELKENLKEYAIQLKEEEIKARTLLTGYYLMACKMQYENRKGIPYREQYDFLKHFLSETNMVKIYFGNRLLQKKEEKISTEQVETILFQEKRKDLKQILISKEDLDYIEDLKTKLQEDSFYPRILIEKALMGIENIVEEYNFLKRSEQVLLKKECQEQIALLLDNVKQNLKESMQLERKPS